MGDTFHNFFQRGLRLPLTLVATDCLKSVDHIQFNQKTAATNFARYWAERDVDGALLTCSCGQGNGSTHHGIVVSQRLIQEWIPFIRFIKERLKRATHGPTGGHLHQVFCRQIQGLNVKVGVQQYDTGRQQV